MVNLAIVTGVYGAGKTLAAQTFEEAGFFVTDNIPLLVADKYFEEIEKDPIHFQNVCLTVDHEIALETYELAKRHKNIGVKFIGITCSAAVLNERYRLSRKIHPRQPKGVSLEKAIENDIAEVRKMTDYFDILIDSTKLNKNEFRNIIFDTVIGSKNKFSLSFFSFGYKVSVPQDIETVFDVRLLPNPFWVPELKHKTGLDKEVRDYVLKAKETKVFLKHIIEYLDFYLNELKKNDRHHASIGIACSGGQHRSVVIAEYLAKHYSGVYNVHVSHKDLPTK